MTSIVYPTTNLRHVEQLNIVRGEGVYVYDDSGKEYLEGLAGLWCASLGYGNVELIEAITSQLKTLSYSHMFGGRTHNVVIQLAEQFSCYEGGPPSPVLPSDRTGFGARRVMENVRNTDSCALNN